MATCEQPYENEKQQKTPSGNRVLATIRINTPSQPRVARLETAFLAALSTRNEG